MSFEVIKMYMCGFVTCFFSSFICHLVCLWNFDISEGNVRVLLFTEKLVGDNFDHSDMSVRIYIDLTCARYENININIVSGQC